MGKISTYSIDALPTLDDKVIGTDADNQQITKNYLLSDIVGLVPEPTLQTVLDAGNIATQDIILKGVVNTDRLILGVAATFFGSAEFQSGALFDGTVHLNSGVQDDQANLGAAGQFLSTTGTSVRWATPPSSPGTLQEVLDTGNSATQDINLNGSIQATGSIITQDIVDAGALAVHTVSDFIGEATFRDNVRLNAGLFDAGGNLGTPGQVLISTGTYTKWVDNVVVVEPNLNVVLEASSFNIQEPTGTNTSMQVEFGAAQTHQDLELDSNGTIRFLTDGTYFIQCFGNVERNGNSGGVANLLYRILINGVQSGHTYGVDLNSVGIMIPLTISQPIKVSATDTLEFEIMRDDNGVNQGGLYTHVVAGGIWQTVPSASITIWKLN